MIPLVTLVGTSALGLIGAFAAPGRRRTEPQAQNWESAALLGFQTLRIVSACQRRRATTCPLHRAIQPITTGVQDDELGEAQPTPADASSAAPRRRFNALQ